MTAHPDTEVETASAPCGLNWLATTTAVGVTRNKTAELLGVDPRTIDRAVDKGDLPSVRIGGRVFIPTLALRKLFGIEDGAA